MQCIARLGNDTKTSSLINILLSCLLKHSRPNLFNLGKCHIVMWCAGRAYHQ